MKNNGKSLYEVNFDVVCLKCGHKGAIQSYGQWHERGLGDDVDSFGSISKPLMEKYRNSSYMSHTMGFGGTIPWQCTNCKNIGLIDFGGLEGYEQAFISIEKAEKYIIDSFSKIDEVTSINQKENMIYVYYKSKKYDDKIMNKLLKVEMDLEDSIKLTNFFDLHYIPSLFGSLEEIIGKDSRSLYLKRLK